MLKVISALLLAAMFIGCGESATTEAAPAVEEANMTAEVAAPVEANATEANVTEANATAQ